MKRILLPPLFLIAVIASTADAPVASIGSMTKISRSSISPEILHSTLSPAMYPDHGKDRYGRPGQKVSVCEYSPACQVPPLKSEQDKSFYRSAFWLLLSVSVYPPLCLPHQDLCHFICHQH